MRTGRKTILAAVTAALAGCAAIPPEPIRIVDSRTDMAACRRLGDLGPPIRTDTGGLGDETGTDLADRVQVLRTAALERGATDLLLVRKPYRDWSFIQGIAYRCPR